MSLAFAWHRTELLMNDFKQALRQIRKRPGGALVILGTLSLVIGAMGMILGLIQSDRARWMPFPQSDQVVRLWHLTKHGAQDRLPSDSFRGIARNLTGLQAIAALGMYDSMVLTGIGEAKTMSTQKVEAAVFDIMRVPFSLGRPFTAEEVHAGEDRLAVISEELWETCYERDPDVLGREMTLNNSVFQIIGVLPPGMNNNALFYGTDILLPFDLSTPGENESYYLNVVGRRGESVSPKQLNDELASIVSSMNVGMAHEGVESLDDEFSVVALRADKRPDSRIDGELVFGLTIPFLVLGIAAFNVANILLARMLTRRHEFAVRFSLGANRWRIMRQLVAESTMLALIAAAIGLVVAFWAAQWARRIGLETRFGPMVVIWTTLFALFAGIAVGWLPALRATRGDFSFDLKDASVAAAGGGVSKHRLRNMLVVGQVGMATVLCIAAGLMLRSQGEKRRFDPGFDASRFLSISVSVDKDQYPESAGRSQYNETVLERLRNIPGVERVGFASDRAVKRYPFPKGFKRMGKETYERSSVGVTMLGSGYLEMLNVPILKGRTFQRRDRRGAPDVMLVNQSFVDRHFPGEDPIGEELGFTFGGKERWPVIVGVVADRPNLGRVRDLGPEAYFSFNQVAPEWASPSFLVETAVASGGFRKGVREAVKSIDLNLPVGRVRPLDLAIAGAMEDMLTGLRAMSAISMFGLLIAMLGIYGVVGYSVTERQREFGIRMALGSSRGRVLRLILHQGLSFVLVGLVLGLLLASAVTIAMEEFIYGISPYDLTTYLIVVLVLVGAACVATLIPGLRAIRIDPVHSLRYE